MLLPMEFEAELLLPLIELELVIIRLFRPVSVFPLELTITLELPRTFLEFEPTTLLFPLIMSLFEFAIELLCTLLLFELTILLLFPRTILEFELDN